MKSTLFSLTAAALLCCTSFTATARDTGRGVGAQFASITPSKIGFTPVPRGEQPSFGADSAIAASECQWQVLNIPVRVGAGKVTGANGDKVTPNYIPEMTFHVYVLVDAENAADKSGKALKKEKRAIMLDKEITYVNIPLKKAQNVRVGEKQVDAYNEINVGVFLSPYDIRRIVEKDTADFEDPKGAKAQPNIKIHAIAMEAKYMDASCWFDDKTAKESYISIASDAKSWLSSNWWKKANAENRGAKLMSISETPYASSYYPTYCATRPLYSAEAAPRPFTPSGTSTPATSDSDSGTTTSASDTDTTDTTTTADSEEETTTTTRKGGRKGKNKKS